MQIIFQFHSNGQVIYYGEGGGWGGGWATKQGGGACEVLHGEEKLLAIMKGGITSSGVVFMQ